VFERFTQRARRVLALAHDEANLLNHPFIGTEHLLLGLIEEGEGAGVQALAQLGISLDAVREKVKEAVAPSPTASAGGSKPFTPRAKKVLELSLREAVQLGHNYIDPENILLGIVREGEGVAARVLVELGADLPRVRQKVLVALPQDGLEPAQRGPSCPRCGGHLDGHLQFREMDARPGVGVRENADQLQVTVIYCATCGVTLAVQPGQ
jgi:ATP-dependent Clp protease ATP-binding subunit ClpC